jgi:hypothetical protein
MFVTKKHTTSSNSIQKWRSRGFSLLISLFAFALFAAGGFEFYNAWIIREPGQDPHLWHISELVALAILLGGTLLTLLRQPEKKPLLAQFLVLGMSILAVGVMFFEIKAAALFIVLGLFIALYPDTRALLSFSREGRISKPLLGLTVLMAFFLAPIAVKEIQWQIMGMTENDAHALLLHWIGSALLMILLVLAGELTSMKRPGWKQLGIITGLTYCFLGVIAMILQSGYAGSWGGGGGLFAIIAGVWYILFTLLEARRTEQKSLTPVPVPVNTQEALSVLDTGKLDVTLTQNTKQLAEV